MSKKRPREQSPRQAQAISKTESGYWRRRLFKNTYTFQGKRFLTHAWCVKLQHRGQRKTFSLHASDPARAASEASAIYRDILNYGWEVALTGRRHGLVQTPPIDPDRLDPEYWAQRLVHREYDSQIIRHDQLQLSIRIDHQGASWYFPLGTGTRSKAAERALNIYKMVVARGWGATLGNVTRELTAAFHWSDNPLAWTYTTFHTENEAVRPKEPPPLSEGARVRVVVAESDIHIRTALQNCVWRMPGFECVATFAHPGDALEYARRHSPHLVLIGQSATEKPGALFLDELRLMAPQVGGLIYSIHEDSEELFRTTPGGAGYYLLKRVAPTRFLEPLAEILAKEKRSSIADAAWEYFKTTVFSLPIGGSARELGNLTQREQEVLALLSKGHQDKAIADRLSISIYTVHVHVRKIFEKLGVHNRTGAVVKYFQK